MKINESFKTLCKLLISIILILFLVKKIDLGQMRSLFINFNYLYFLIALPLVPVIWATYTLRWQILLSALGRSVSFNKLMALNLIGMFYNLFLPGHVSGEIIKVFKLTKIVGEPSRSAISIAMDRLMSILPRLAIIPFCLILSPPLFIDSKFIIAVWTLAFFILLFIAIVSSSRLSSALEKKISLAIQKFRKEGQQDSIFQRLKEGITSLWNTLKVYQRQHFSLWICFGYGLISHILETVHFCLMALALNTEIPFVVALWVLTVVVIVQILPISISGIGVREGAFVFLLGQYGVSPAVAFSLSLIVFLFQILAGGIGGFVEIWARRKLS